MRSIILRNIGLFVFADQKSVKAQIDEMDVPLQTEEMLVAVKGDVVISVALPILKDRADESTMGCFSLKQGSGVV